MTLFPTELTTERLHLERLCHDTVDTFEYYRHCSRHNPSIEEVTARLPWSPHETPKETADYIDDLEAKWENGERAEYVIRPAGGEPGAGEIAGSACLVVDWETKTGTPGIWLRKRFWGRGYSGERAAALIELAFERLDLDLVAIPVEDGNDRSRSAVEGYVERFSGQYDGVVRNATVRPDGRVVDHHRYTITADQFEQSAGERA